MPEAVIAAVARSPIGRAFKGSLAQARPEDLTLQMVQAALARVPELDPSEVVDLMLGCGSPGGDQGWNLARTVAVLAGYDHLPGTTITRYCASSLQTTRMAFHAIRAGEGHAFISAGVEMVSRYPRGHADNIPGIDSRSPHFASAIARTEERAAMANDGGTTIPWEDPRQEAGLPDVFMSMGQTAENVQQVTGITREEQDSFAVRSQNLAERAIDNGFWARDIVSVELEDGTVIAADDGPRRGVTLEATSALRPVFRADGTVTAGNCCALNDGAAALVVMSDVRARELQVTPLARIVSTGVSGLSAEIMGLGPVEATRQALAHAGMSVSDLDLVEINEAFAVQVIASMRELDLDPEKVNVNGGAIAVGHPFGMTGARLTSTMVNSLQAHDQQTGLITMCVGGGMGMAMIVERIG